VFGCFLAKGDHCTTTPPSPLPPPQPTATSKTAITTKQKRNTLTNNNNKKIDHHYSFMFICQRGDMGGAKDALGAALIVADSSHDLLLRRALLEVGG